MSDHSKWAITKHKRAAIDTKRGKLFACLVKNIEVAAHTDGSGPTGNPTLFDTTQKAGKNSAPAGNITRTVRRGSGEETGGADWQTIMYEGYGPGGVAFLVEYLADNRNRAASGMHVASPRNDGNLADPSSVAYSFTHKSVVKVVKADGMDENSILMAVLGAGAGEVEDMDESFGIYSEPGDIVAVHTALTEAGMGYDSTEVQFVADTEVEVDVEGAREVFRLIDAPGDFGGVQNVHISTDLSPEVAAESVGDED